MPSPYFGGGNPVKMKLNNKIHLAREPYIFFTMCIFDTAFLKNHYLFIASILR